jgi:hypothetical protein
MASSWRRICRNNRLTRCLGRRVHRLDSARREPASSLSISAERTLIATTVSVLLILSGDRSALAAATQYLPHLRVGNAICQRVIGPGISEPGGMLVFGRI